MIQIDPSQGISLKFKVNVTGATLEQLSAWANIEPANSDVSYQIPASIENGVLTLKSTLENIVISEKGQIKIKMQHGTNLHDVWNSDYQAVEKVQIVLEQIREEKKVEQPKPIKVVTNVEEKKVEKPVTKIEEKKVEKPVIKEEPKIESKNESSNDEKIFRFNDFK